MSNALAEQMMGKQVANIVVGLGKSGFSCVRYLAAQGIDLMVVDTRERPPYLAKLQQEFPDVAVTLGPLDGELLSRAERLIMSPGLSLDQPAIAQAVADGARISSDIELFCEAVKAPVIAITGSNAKSTVTTLVGLMAEQAGKNVGVGGNLGTPVLELLAEGEKELYVLELSSFQLDICSQLNAEVAVVLNVSADHMDRYTDLAAYSLSKQRIFRGCRQAVINLDEAPVQVPDDAVQWCYSVHQAAGTRYEFGISQDEDERWLMRGEKLLMPISNIRIKGLHNVSNALAALALGSAVGLPMPAMLQTLREFPGLAHRCQWVASKSRVDYYNDSKGTNVGATVAALNGLGPETKGRIVLIAGGDGKGADFDELQEPVAQYCKQLVLLGKDAQRLEAALAESAPVQQVPDMAAAVQYAAQCAKPGDVVLLSPACASLDMFANFEARGETFVQAVEAL